MKSELVKDEDDTALVCLFFCLHNFSVNKTRPINIRTNLKFHTDIDIHSYS